MHKYYSTEELKILCVDYLMSSELASEEINAILRFIAYIEDKESEEE